MGPDPTFFRHPRTSIAQIQGTIGRAASAFFKMIKNSSFRRVDASDEHWHDVVVIEVRADELH